MSCCQLIYISTCRSPDIAEISNDILDVARRENARNDITGLLLFSDPNFLQILEGPELAVRRLFRNIQADPRHEAVTPLRRRSVTHRAFPDWSMAWYCRQDDPSAHGLSAEISQVQSVGSLGLDGRQGAERARELIALLCGTEPPADHVWQPFDQSAAG